MCARFEGEVCVCVCVQGEWVPGRWVHSGNLPGRVCCDPGESPELGNRCSVERTNLQLIHKEIVHKKITELMYFI